MGTDLNFITSLNLINNTLAKKVAEIFLSLFNVQLINNYASAQSLADVKLCHDIIEESFKTKFTFYFWSILRFCYKVYPKYPKGGK